jgi:hypothetical protein
VPTKVLPTFGNMIGDGNPLHSDPTVHPAGDSRPRAHRLHLGRRDIGYFRTTSNGVPVLDRGRIAYTS